MAGRIRSLLLLSVAVVTALVVPPGPAAAQEARFVRIATGPVGGTYFPVGSLIATTLSGPPGSRACETGEGCGVPGLIVTAVSTQGSLDNVRRLQSGAVELALCQADVAHDARAGSGPFAGRPVATLRAVADLYPETMHVVVRAGEKLRGLRDLKGRRIAFGESDSGTLVTARTVLRAYGLGLDRLAPVFERPSRSAEELVGREIDGFFLLGGAPLAIVTAIAGRAQVALLPIAGREATRILAGRPFLSAATIPAETYPGVPATPTIAVGAELLVTTTAPDDLVYALTRALWDPRNRRALDAGGAAGRRITLQSALDRLAVPPHPGALRYYREAGLLPATEARP